MTRFIRCRTRLVKHSRSNSHLNSPQQQWCTLLLSPTSHNRLLLSSTIKAARTTATTLVSSKLSNTPSYSKCNRAIQLLEVLITAAFSQLIRPVLWIRVIGFLDRTKSRHIITLGSGQIPMLRNSRQKYYFRARSQSCQKQIRISAAI